MKLEFIECDMHLDKEGLDKLSGIGNWFFVIEEYEERDPANSTWYEDKYIKKRKIETLVMLSDSLVIYAHDMLTAGRDEMKRIVGYCPVEFPDGVDNIAY